MTCSLNIILLKWYEKKLYHFLALLDEFRKIPIYDSSFLDSYIVLWFSRAKSKADSPFMINWLYVSNYYCQIITTTN